MKRSKLFLGATAFVLAIAGAFASKASNKLTLVTGYYTDGTGAGCIQQFKGCFTSGAGAICRTSSNLGAKTVYKTETDCQVALHTRQN